MIDVRHMTLSELNSLGYAVTVFTPEELKGVSPGIVADLMCERGSDAIESLALQEYMEATTTFKAAIFDALDACEGMEGPEYPHYIKLMKEVADDAAARAKTAEENWAALNAS